jgi:MscS family membrane protein
MMLLLLQVDFFSFDNRIAGEKISNLLWCVGIIIVALLIKKPAAKAVALLSTYLANRFTEKRHKQKFYNLIRHPLESLLQVILFYIALSQLHYLLDQFALDRFRKHTLALSFGDIIDHIFLFLGILFSTLLLSRIADYIYYIQREKAVAENNKERQQLLPLVKEVGKLVLWTIGIFWLLGSVFHVNIPALITGLGIGGVAIALAAKESLENLIAAFTILTDKPFSTGDSVKLGTLEGVVERIGFRSTKLRSPDGSAHIIPNKKLVMENLENLSQRYIRRVKLSINIRYGISHGDIQTMINELKDMLQNTTHVKGPLEVNIESFGENVLQLVVSYYLPEPLPDTTTLSKMKQEVTLSIYGIINKYAAFNAVSVNDASQAGQDISDEENAGKKEDSII